MDFLVLPRRVSCEALPKWLFKDALRISARSRQHQFVDRGSGYLPKSMIQNATRWEVLRGTRPARRLLQGHTPIFFRLPGKAAISLMQMLSSRPLRADVRPSAVVAK